MEQGAFDNLGWIEIIFYRRGRARHRILGNCGR